MPLESSPDSSKPKSPTEALLAPISVTSEDVCEVQLAGERNELFTVAIYRETAHYQLGTVKRWPSPEALAIESRFPSSKRIKCEHSPFALEVPATEITALILTHVWPQDKFFFLDEQSQFVFDSLLLQSRAGDYLAESVAKFKVTGELPKSAALLELPAENQLSPYQKLAACNSLIADGYGLFMEPGTGKTAISIAVACNLIAKQAAASKSMLRVIVVCPKNVRANWQSELGKFSTRGGKCTVLRGDEVGRVKQIIDAAKSEDDCEFSVLVCSYETMSRSIQALELVPWDLTILDEAHAIKSIKTARFKNSLRLRDRSQQIGGKRLALTGTPIGNSLLDLYPLLEFLGEGYSGFKDFKSFRSFFGVYDGSDLASVQNVPFLQEILARRSYIVKLKEVLPDLPERIYEIYEIEMGKQQREFYQQLAMTLAVEIEAKLAADNVNRAMVVQNILTQLLRLSQITSGFVSWQPIYDDDGNLLQEGRIEYFDENPKIEGALDIVQSLGTKSKAIFWACWRPDIEYLEHAFKSIGIECVTFFGDTTDDERARAEYEFNHNDSMRVFIGNAASGGTGLNLLGFPPNNPDASEMNADTVVFFSQGWSAILRGQAEARANRRGTRVPTKIIDLVAPNTIDETIRVRVLEKQQHAWQVSDIQNTLKTILDNTKEL